MSTVHAVAAGGFGQGTNALVQLTEKYDRARPSYPAGILSLLHDALPAEARQRGLKILEPGAGTGIFTRLLLAPPSAEYPTWNIDTLVGIEPSSGMRGAWEEGMQRIAKPSDEGEREKKVLIVDGTFDDFSDAKKAGIEEGTADLIVIAQAFHWCPNFDAAFTEMAKYLSPTGVLAFVWNLESGHVKWQMRARELFQPFDRGTPQYYKGLWREGFKAPAYDKYFEAPEEKQVSWYRNVDDQGVIDKILSKSYLTEQYLNGDARTKFIEDFKALLKEAEPEKEYVDEKKQTYRLRYDTDLIIMRKK